MLVAAFFIHPAELDVLAMLTVLFAVALAAKVIWRQRPGGGRPDDVARLRDRLAALEGEVDELRRDLADVRRRLPPAPPSEHVEPH